MSIFFLIFLLPIFDQFLSLFDQKLIKIDQKLVAEKSKQKLTKIDKIYLFLTKAEAIDTVNAAHSDEADGEFSTVFP